MSTKADRYRAVILRAVFGTHASTGKVQDLYRLNQLCEHLASCEDVQVALRAKGYGRAGMTFQEVAQEVPVNALGRIKNWFEPKADPVQAELSKLFDIWSSR